MLDERGKTDRFGIGMPRRSIPCFDVICGAECMEALSKCIPPCNKLVIQNGRLLKNIELIICIYAYVVGGDTMCCS